MSVSLGNEFRLKCRVMISKCRAKVRNRELWVKKCRVMQE